MSVVVPLAPEPGPAVDLEGNALRDWLAARYALAGDSWLRLNLVTGLGGQITGPSGTSDDLTGGIDRVLLGVLRRSAQAVLVGAGSLRAEAAALPRTAQLAVATRSGRIAPGDLPEPDGGRRALVLCSAERAGGLGRALGSRARVVAVPDEVEQHAGLLAAALADEGCTRVVCEGGGVLAGALLADAAVDELDQTIAPVLLSPGVPLLSGSVPPTTASLAGLLRDGTDRLYARWTPIGR